MKKLLSFLLAASLLAPAAALAASFEGKLSIKVTPADGQSRQIDISVKDALTRMEMPDGPMGGGAMIMDSAKRQVTIIMPQRHMYMVQPMPAPQTPPTAAPDTPAAQPHPEPALEKTSETEKILGYDCVKYIAKDNGTTAELWITDQLGTFSFLDMASGGPMGPGMRGGQRGARGAGVQALEHLLKGKEMFPLRVISTAADGKVNRFEIVALEKKPQPASDFAPPADYQDMGQMMKGMGMPGGMRPPAP